jgi:hypothetical protein
MAERLSSARVNPNPIACDAGSIDRDISTASTSGQHYAIPARLGHFIGVVSIKTTVTNLSERLIAVLPPAPVV